MRLNLLVGLGVIGIAACGGGGVEVEDLPDELVSKICSAQVDCGQFPDIDSCRDAIGLDLDIDSIKADIDSGVIDYDADAAERCIDAYDALLTCELLLVNDAFIELEEACEAVFAGTVAAGGACTEDEQCVGSGQCELTECPDQCCSGTCAAAESNVRVEIGQSCANADCVAGAYCEGETETCAARVAVGGSCGDFDACVAGSVCDLDFVNNTGTCVELNGEGGSCDPEMVFFQCLRSDNFCDPADSTCKRALDVGATCEVGQCVGYADCVDNTCVARPKLGETCVVDGEQRCLGSLDCVGGTCVAEGVDDYCPLGG